MSKALRLAPAWMRRLSSKERAKAWAIYLFMQYDQGKITESKQVDYFAKCVERADWPNDGLFPVVSKTTAKRLGIDHPRWDSWRKFAPLRKLLQRKSKLNGTPILRKKLKIEKKRVING